MKEGILRKFQQILSISPRSRKGIKVNLKQVFPNSKIFELLPLLSLLLLLLLLVTFNFHTFSSSITGSVERDSYTKYQN